MGLIARIKEMVASAEAQTAGSRSVAFTATDVLPTTESGMTRPAAPEHLDSDRCYLELFIRSFWLPKSRRFTSEISGAVHVYSEVIREGEDRAKIAYVSKPSELDKVDGKAAMKVIAKSQQALGPVPWRGQQLGLEIGLFSVKVGDLTASYLDLMTELSGKAGISYVSFAAPFIPVVRKGIELLAGNIGNSCLEIGLDTTITRPQTGDYAIIAADRDLFQGRTLSVAADSMLLVDGDMVRDYPWLVYTVVKSTERADFGEIPDLKDAWAKFRRAVRDNRRNEAEEALNAFRRIAITSPDLITSDAKRLVDKATGLMAEAFSNVNMNAAGGKDIPELADLKIYGFSQ